ncbi:hypothetical protein [Cobetia crustatorum]|uniref:Uncharacterized protein n=1 Tax=Cobetia crustatorum TaxID=553385 RepID=A0A558HWN2_9GAMM|nr:hypothetical protein [Cobetia crustatorum]TVU73525.1 hypothetical protein FQP86_00080 [Cobetia crustatorum]
MGNHEHQGLTTNSGANVGRTPRPRRATLDNPASQLGRTYLALSESRSWLMLHELAAEILARFDRLDSEAAISARLRDLRRHHGVRVESRRRGGSAAHEYRLLRLTRGKSQPDMLEALQ